MQGAEALFEQLRACIAGSWSPGIGDPHLMGWMIAGLYAVTAILALLVAIRQPFPARSRRREAAFWMLVSLVLIALAVNKQLDLQSLMTAAGRCLARIQGWYDDRRLVQRDFIVTLGIALAGLLVVSTLLLRGTLRRTGLPLIGLLFVAGFVLIRAIGFHHFDALINMQIISIKMNWLLEIPGPVLVGAAALWLLLAPRSANT